MGKESEASFPQEPSEPKTVRKIKRKKKRHKRSLWSMVKKGIWWGIAIGVALISIIFAVISYNW